MRKMALALAFMACTCVQNIGNAQVLELGTDDYFGEFTTCGGWLWFQVHRDLDWRQEVWRTNIFTTEKVFEASEEYPPADFLKCVDGKILYVDLMQLIAYNPPTQEHVFGDFVEVDSDYDNFETLIPSALFEGALAYLINGYFFTGPQAAIYDGATSTRLTPDGVICQSVITGGEFMLQNSQYVFFVATDTDVNDHGSYEVWRSAGGVEDAVMVKDISPGVPLQYHPFLFAVHNDKLIFGERYAEEGYGLYETDGTTSGTLKLCDFPLFPYGGFGSSGGKHKAFSFPGGLLFAMRQGDDGLFALVVIDDVTGDPVMLADVDAEGVGVFLGFIDGFAFYQTSYGAIWITNGTPFGTFSIGSFDSVSSSVQTERGFDIAVLDGGESKIMRIDTEGALEVDTLPGAIPAENMMRIGQNVFYTQGKSLYNYTIEPSSANTWRPYQ
jgi:ELWxxDGT repeat protein